MKTLPLRLASLFIAGALSISRCCAQDDENDDWWTKERHRMIAEQNEKNFEAEIAARAKLQQTTADNSADIADARQKFWALYPDKPGFAEAQQRFSDLLFGKDLTYLVEPPAMLAVVGLGQNQLDGGIPQEAKPAFSYWVKSVSNKTYGTDQMMTSNLTAVMEMPVKLPKALIDSKPYYDAYTIQRDWAEFDAAHRDPAGSEDPRVYGTMLCCRWEKQSSDEALAEYKSMEAVLGAAAVRAAMAKIHAAPKDDEGEIADLGALGLVREKMVYVQGPHGDTAIPDDSAPAPDGKIPIGDADPLQAAVALITQGDARLNLLFLIAQESPELQRKNDQNRTDYGDLTEYRYDWNYAKAQYDHYVAGFGVDAVQAAAQKILSAPRNTRGYLIKAVDPDDPAVDPFECFTVLLFADHKNFVRSVLVDHAPTDPPAAIDEAYQKLVATYGEAPVLDAGATLAHAKLFRLAYKAANDFDALYGLLAGTLTIVDPNAEKPKVANPKYLAWKDCPPNTKVEYLSTFWDVVPGRAKVQYPYETWTDTLQSVDAADVRYLEITTSHRDDNSVSVRDMPNFMPAKVEPSPVETTLRSGDETLTIDGRKLYCHWVTTTKNPNAPYVAENTTWTNDQVPGHIVRKLSINPDGDLFHKTFYEEVVTKFDPVPGAPVASGPETPSGVLELVSPIRSEEWKAYGMAASNVAIHKVARNPAAAPGAPVAAIAPTPSPAPIVPAPITPAPVAPTPAVAETRPPPTAPEIIPSPAPVPKPAPPLPMTHAPPRAPVPPGTYVVQPSNPGLGYDPAHLPALPPWKSPDTAPTSNSVLNTTGSADLDARLQRVYEAPGNPALPAQMNYALRRSIWSMTHGANHPNIVQVQQLSKLCDLLENGFSKQFPK